MRVAEAVAKVTDELRAEHNTTIHASANMLRRVESENETKREQELMAQQQELNERLTREAEADKKAALEAVEAEKASRLAEVRIEASAGMASAIAKAAAAAEAETTARLEEEHKAHVAQLAERQAHFNKTFKALLKQLIEQPQAIASPKSPKGVPLALTFEP